MKPLDETTLLETLLFLLFTLATCTLAVIIIIFN